MLVNFEGADKAFERFTEVIEQARIEGYFGR